jgi:hypothetical protein
MIATAVLILALHAAAVAAEPSPAKSCAPLTTAAIPADYLFYHGLVTTHPLTRPRPSEKPRLQASCTSHKVIRT